VPRLTDLKGLLILLKPQKIGRLYHAFGRLYHAFGRLWHAIGPLCDAIGRLCDALAGKPAPPLSPLALYPRRGSPKAGGDGKARPRRRGAGCAAPSGDSWRILDGFCESPAKPRPVWVFQIGVGRVKQGVGES